MALVSYVNPTPDLKDRFDKTFTPVYKTKHSSLRWNGRLIPPRKKIDISSKSLLPQVSALWAALTDEDRLAWKLAAANWGYNAWTAFVQDTTYRIKYGISGLATPSIYHGYKVGRIEMASPADNFRLEQLHPIEYFRSRKVRGTKNQREIVSIQEQLQLPLQVGLSYRTNLTSNGPNPYCRFYAEVVTSLQGLDPIQTVGVEIPLVSDWAADSATLTDVVGHARWYSLFIELNDVLGVIEFDLVKAIHTGTNFAREFRCTNISTGFTNYNYQIPASWAADSPEDGVTWGSVYAADEPL